ncbi:unnamed protein product [Closterium sp. Naga37s-1]|nr:unnamed protein product [Closterium sp. Naga37s-1]
MRSLPTAQALYDAVFARYSSPATAALGRLLLPYLFPELSAFATVEDLVSHLRASDARYRATVPAEFLDRNLPPMFITLYFIVTRLPDSLRSVRDHFLSLDPTSLTVDLLEEHLLAAETSAVAVGAARGTPRTPFFEGCSPSHLAPSYASAAAADVPSAEDVGAASASAKRRSSKGKGGRGGGGGSGSGGGGSSGGSGGGGGGGGGGTGGRGGSSSGGGGGSGGSGGSGGGGTGGGRTGTRRGGSGGGQRQQQQRRSETQSPQQLREWLFQRIEAAALGASESGTLPGTAPAEALHTFTLDSGASRCFFRDSTTLTPLPAPVPVRLADPCGGPVVARSSTVLPWPAVPSGSLSGLHLPSFSTNLVSTAALQDAMVTTTTPAGQRVSICTCTRTGRHLAMFTRRPGLSLYTLATKPSQVAASAQVSALGQVAPPCSCRLLSHQMLLWHHRLGHPSLPRLRGMHSRLLVSGLPRSLPPLPPLPAPPCLPCVEGRQRAAPHSSFPPTIAPLQTLHMDVWDPARVSGQGRERYFLLVVDDYTRYTTVFPLRSKGQVVDGSRAFVRDTSADKLSARAIPCVFLGFVPDAPGWQFYHPTSHRVLPSQDVTFDESVPFYRLFPYRSAPLPPLPLFLAPDPLPVDPLPPQGLAPSGVSQVDPPPGVVPGEVAVDSGAARGTASAGSQPGGTETGGAEPGGAETGVSETGGAEPEGVEPGGAESEGAESGGAEPQGAASSGDSAGASPRLSPQLLREWLVRRARLRSGATGAGGAGAAGAGGAGVTEGACVPGGTAATGPGGARTQGTGAAGTGGVGGAGAGDPTESGAAGAGGFGAGGAGAEGAGVGGNSEGGAGAGGAGAADLGGTMRPPTVSRLLATAVTEPSFESSAASALIAELLDFAAACRLDYATALVAESASASPPSVRGECALGTDVLEDRQEEFECLAAAVPHFASMVLAPEGDPDAPDIPTPRSYAEAITGPYSSQWQAAMDAEMTSWKSTGTYVDAVPPPGANIVDGMWIFRVKRPPGSPPAFKARYVARGFSQRQGVDYFQTFSPTPKMTTLRVLLHVAAQRDYDLHSLDFSTAFL